MYSKTETSKWFLNKCNMCHLHQKSVSVWKILEQAVNTVKKNKSSPFKNNIFQDVSPQDFVEILHGTPHQHFKIIELVVTAKTHYAEALLLLEPNISS